MLVTVRLYPDIIKHFVTMVRNVSVFKALRSSGVSSALSNVLRLQSHTGCTGVQLQRPNDS